MFSNTAQMPTAKTVVSAAGSAAATVMVIRSIANEFLPHEIRGYFALKLRSLLARFSNELTLVIEEFDDGLLPNKLFKAAKVFLEPRIPPSVGRIKINLPDKETQISCSVEKNEEIVDIFDGVKLKWKFASKQVPIDMDHHRPRRYNNEVKSEDRFFELSFHKKHKQMVMDVYLPHVQKQSNGTSKQKKPLKLFTLRSDRMHGMRGDVWQSVNLDHPATFDTLAMDLEVKEMIMDDLQRFVRRKEFYRKVGKAWKRGYLLFGPPGTGKTSLIAAMANYLKFDVYDMELTNLRRNMELRNSLIATENKSILVVEDIDCSIELQDRCAQTRAGNPMINNSAINLNQVPQMTLSGLLNFIDGLWSSCGDERIIVFTTNHKERLNPALLRPGRMDVHIHMSYCTPCGFKMLASNYLGITEHPLFEEIEELMEKAKVTPSEVAEQLMRDEASENALRGLTEFLQIKKRENDESKSEQEGAVEAESSIQAIEGNANGDILIIQ